MLGLKQLVKFKNKKSYKMLSGDNNVIRYVIKKGDIVYSG